MRLFRLLLVALISLALLVPGVASAGPDGGAAVASAAAKKKCKKGFVRNKKGKCIKPKKPAPKPPVVPATPAEPATPATPATPLAPEAPAPDRVRNDQALIDALKSTVFYKTYSGGGFGSYAYNFLPQELGTGEGVTFFRLRYCTFYNAVGFGSSRDNHDGTWSVKEGYTHKSDPTLFVGVLYLYRKDLGQQIVEAPVAVRGNEAAIKTGNGSKYFEPGDYQNKPGRATTDCSTWEPA